MQNKISSGPTLLFQIKQKKTVFKFKVLDIFNTFERISKTLLNQNRSK